MCAMAEPCVCDLTLIMRTRLLCGLYNNRSVPPRWRNFARAYCVMVAIAISVYIYYVYLLWDYRLALHSIPTFVLYFLNIFISLWTGDEYIYNFFKQNKFTDVTLESTKIFSRLQRQMRQAYCISIGFYFAYWGLATALMEANGIIFLMYSSLTFTNLLLSFVSANIFMIMALFDARMLVLKRRLQRYGFRTIGRAPPQPYYQIYDEILKGLEATDSPLKLLLSFDLICNCCKSIAGFAFYIFKVHWKFEICMEPNFKQCGDIAPPYKLYAEQSYPNYGDISDIEMLGKALISAATGIERIVFTFGHVAFLESAATHCQDMAVFTATQLIKTPSIEERRRMRQFLDSLERRGARYRLVRALPIDARFAARVLGFCTAQIIVFVTSVKTS